MPGSVAYLHRDFRVWGSMNDLPGFVLVVDDHPVNQRVAAILLADMGFDSMVVDDGKPAVEAFLSHKPDIIIMDLMMPIMDGFEASKQIRSFEFGKSKHTPIIACTALDESRVREDCLQSGIDDYICKPYSRELLARKLNAWLKVETKAKIPELTNYVQAVENDLKKEEILNKKFLQLLYGIDELDSILALFLEVTKKLLDDLDSAIEMHDSVKVRRIAHEIRSGSLAIDASEMARLCIDLEEAVENWPEVVKTYPVLALAFTKVHEFFQLKKEEGGEGVGLSYN